MSAATMSSDMVPEARQLAEIRQRAARGLAHVEDTRVLLAALDARQVAIDSLRALAPTIAEALDRRCTHHVDCPVPHEEWARLVSALPFLSAAAPEGPH